jgi:hypothetical protein
VKKYISCGHNGVAYVRPTDKDPRVADQYKDNPDDKNWPELNANGGKATGDCLDLLQWPCTNLRLEFPNGAHWHEFSKGILALTAGQPTDPAAGLCRTTTVDGILGGDLAQSRSAWGVIFLCEYMLKGEDFIHNAADWLRNDLMPGTELYDIYQPIIPKTFAHELCHVWNAGCKCSLLLSYNPENPVGRDS